MSMTREELLFLKNSRKYLRGKATRKCSAIESGLNAFSSEELRHEKAVLQDIRDELKNSNQAISKGLWQHETGEDALVQELEKCDEYNEKLIRTMRLLDEKLIAGAAQAEVRGFPDESTRIGNQLKLPQIPLPEYSHDPGESLDKFFNGFEAIMDKYSLSPYVKFVFLQKQLFKEPRTLINSLEGDQQSYAVAKDLLTKAFASPTVKKFDIIKRMADLKLDDNDDPYKFISEMRVVIETFKNMKLDTESVLQYFIWNGLNNTFKNQLIAITNTTKPSFSQITENIFDATERYLVARSTNSRSGKTSPKSTAGLAASLQYDKSPTQPKFKPCVICTKDGIMNVDHPIHKCLNYSTAVDKLKKLKTIGACLKCANIGHTAANCKFRLHNNCRFCGKPHFSFLCKSAQHPQSETAKSDAKVCVVASGSESSDDTVLLPTFTCEVPSGSVVRGLKDSGSQACLITEKLADREKFKVIDPNFEIVVNGVNSPKKYKTKTVQLKLKFGDSILEIPAICIPEIKTNLKVPGLGKVVTNFISKGYDLADKLLVGSSDKIGNIQLMLGARAFHGVPGRDVVFGGDIKSVYMDTKVGVMLIGPIEQLVANLNYLPSVSTVDVLSCDADEANNAIRCEPRRDESRRVLYSRACNSEETDDSNTRIINVNFTAIDRDAEITEKELSDATERCLSDEDVLNNKCNDFLNYEKVNYNEVSVEANNQLVDYVLDNIQRDDSGRLLMRITWNGEVCHLLGRNLELCRKILESNLKKLLKTSGRLEMVDSVFREQETGGVIERIENLSQFLEENPKAAFLAHMPVFRLDKDTTKCRVVYLSNICQKDPTLPTTFNHNQCITAGPSINKKVSTSILQLRFDAKLVCFDLVKAFLQLGLFPSDQIRLCFLWFENISKKNFNVVAYRSLRVPFGLKCSPALLMMALFHILIVDTLNDSQQLKNLKKSIYDLAYMDNLAFTCNGTDELNWAYNKLNDIFTPYKFSLQQFATNDVQLHERISPGECMSDDVKLLGLVWNRGEDTLAPAKLCLNEEARTKRTILSSIASNFDIFGMAGPLLNRARLFMHELQCQKSLGWDNPISDEQRNNWRNISRQVNNAPPVSHPRCVGRRDDEYELRVFTDSSKTIYGTVVYLYNLRTKHTSFVTSKNRIVNQQMENKTIPSLELQAISLGVECAMEIRRELCGTACVTPVIITKIRLFSDSLVCLSWLNSYVNDLDKMQNRSIFVMNRLNSIKKLCEEFPVQFRFCAGTINPADCVTRAISYKQLLKSSYFTGPEVEDEMLESSDLPDITIPNPLCSREYRTGQNVTSHPASVLKTGGPAEPLIEVSKFSNYRKLINSAKNVLKFVNLLKHRINLKRSVRNDGKLLNIVQDSELESAALRLILLTEQKIYYADVLDYFESEKTAISEIPTIVSKFNIFRDENGLLRVKSKMSRWKQSYCNFPILLPNCGNVCKLYINHLHKKLSHAGVYTVISELVKNFWLPHRFSVVKSALKKCVNCRRFNRKTVKINQSPYRDFRVNPPDVPYKYTFLDYCGPYETKIDGKRSKVYVLCLTCLWSRAINLKLCLDLSVQEFLRAFQLHCFEFGVPEQCYSDRGSQIVAGTNIIANFIENPDSHSYFRDCGVEPLSFQQYDRGCNELGSLVECCVKLVKRLIYGAIKKSVLEYNDFAFLISQTVHLVNRRPVSFKETLRDDSMNEFPAPITPEILLKGYELTSLNLIPSLQPIPVDPDWHKECSAPEVVRDNFSKLAKARQSLVKIYNEEFVVNLIDQATDVKGRYQPKKHYKLEVGDIVLLKEPLQKPSNYPMAIVRSVTTNVLDEVTNVVLFKGSTREIVKRHVTSLIPLLSAGELRTPTNAVVAAKPTENVREGRKLVRSAALLQRERTLALIDDDAI